MLNDVQPCRELDALLHERYVRPVLRIKSGVFDQGQPIPAYSRSIDAAIWLCLHLLPGWAWQISSNHDEHTARLAPTLDEPTENGPGLALSSTAETPAIPLIACLLSVLSGLEKFTAPRRDAGELLTLAQEASDNVATGASVGISALPATI